MKIILFAVSRFISAMKPITFSMLAMLTARSALAATPLYHYDFNGDTVHDLVGSVDGALLDTHLYNGALSTGIPCAECNSGYVKFPQNIVPVGAPFSIAFFAAEFSLGGPDGRYPTHGTIISQGPEFQIGFQDRLFRIGDTNLGAGFPFPDDRGWHHYAVTAAADETRLFIDGNLAAKFGAIGKGGRRLNLAAGTVF